MADELDANANPDSTAPVRPLSLAAVALTGILAGGALGGIANAVNGWVSPLYFVTILRWEGVDDVWRASIAQGIFEGLGFGVIFSLLFTTGLALITRAACPYVFAVRHLAGIVAGALAGWLLGGLAAMGLASLSPDFYRQTFTGVPDDFREMLAYAWVGGSIWGIELGGLISVVLDLVVLWSNWQRLQDNAARD